MNEREKSFIFVVSDFDVGGITTSLRNLTDILIKEGHSVSIMNLPGITDLPYGFNREVKLINLKGKAQFWNINMWTIRSSIWYKRPFLLFFAMLKKFLNRTDRWQRFIFSGVMITGFDVAVAFRQSPLCYNFVHNNTEAQKKIGFWHGDPLYLEGVQKWIKCLEDIDYVACVSRSVEKRMRQLYPQYSEKYKTVYNIFNADEIKQKSLEYQVDSYEPRRTLVTVARVDFAQKQLNFIPEIALRLKNLDMCFQWIIVGDGPDLKKLQEMIVEKDISDCVKCVGNKKNPFPYVGKADLFVNTSLGEAYGMVIVESLILNIPCVVGEYPAAKEIIDDGVNGIVTENSIDGIFKAIEMLFQNSERFEQLKRGARQYRYNYVPTYKMFMELC